MSRRAARRRLTLLATATLALLATVAIAAEAASADTQTVGLGGWQVQSSAQATQSPQQISTPGFPTGSWLHVRPDDAGAVGTEVGALVQTGHCPDVFFSTNIKTCFGYMDSIGADTIPEFSVPWWFRTDFFAHANGSGRAGSQSTDLIINGVVGQADVWVNGQEVATQATVQGDYTRYTFDITGLLQRGLNTLALEVYPNNPNTMFTLDNVDWTQIPPDNNTGIQFPIQLHTSGAAGAEQRARRPGRCRGPFDCRANGEIRRHQPCLDAADRHAVGRGRDAHGPHDPCEPDGDGGGRSDADVLVQPERRPPPEHPSSERVVARRHGRASALRAARRR